MPGIKHSNYNVRNTTFATIIMTQYVLRMCLVVPLSNQIIKAAGVVTKSAWGGAAYNLLLYMLASHITGALYYLLSIGRQITCWNQQCLIQSNISCDLNFISCEDALTKGVSTAFREKYFYCLWWGLLQLSSSGNPLKTSAFIVENVFAIVIGATSLILFARLIGEMQPPTSFKSFAVEDRPGEQWVRLRAAHRGTEEIKIDATMFDGAAEPGPDASLFRRVEALEQGPRLHLSLIVEVARADRVLGFICSAWPDDLTVRHVLTLKGAGTAAAASGDRSGRDFAKLEPREREAVKKFLQEREIDAELAEFLHDYVANKEKMELLRWLKTVESFVEK
ncbi:unnamed protein product [Alopecurus aequalis]